MNTEVKKCLETVLDEQELLCIRITSCLADLVKLVPSGEDRIEYLSHLDMAVKSLHSFNAAAQALTDSFESCGDSDAV